MPPQNPLTRIEAVAEALGVLGSELADYLGPDAQRTLHHWQRELREAVDALQKGLLQKGLALDVHADRP
jgi:hypothetical protein